jgi:hypothetical protein
LDRACDDEVFWQLVLARWSSRPPSSTRSGYWTRSGSRRRRIPRSSGDWQIEKSFRMSKSDLRARPIYHHKPDPIEAHLTIVMAALAVSRWLEHVTGWSIKKLVQTLRRYRSIAVQAGDHILHAGTLLDDDVRAALNAVKTAATRH